jgi:hypothetical protein
MENSVNASATFILRDALDSNSSTTSLKLSRLPISTISLKSPWRIRIARVVLAVVAGADLGSGLHASYEASSTNRAIALSLFVSYNIVGEAGQDGPSCRTPPLRRRDSPDATVETPAEAVTVLLPPYSRCGSYLPVTREGFRPHPPLLCPWRRFHAWQTVPLCSRAEVVASFVPRDGCLCLPPTRASRVVGASSTSRLWGAAAQVSPLQVKNRPPR